MKMIEVALLKEHTHAGVKRHPGAVIEVNEADYEYLVRHGVAETYEPPKKTGKNDKEPSKAEPKGE